MDQTVEQIEAHIDRTRERLGSSLKELEHKFEAATDWREQLRARPWLLVGAACLGGVALAATLGRPVRRATVVRGLSSEIGGLSREIRRGRHDVRGQALSFWDNVSAALIGVVSARAKDYIGELVPGFDEEFTRAEQRASSLR